MRQKARRHWLWISISIAVLTTAAIVPLAVLADRDEAAFTATLYSDVIRFEADGAASLRVTIYDLAENELWNSGLVMGDFADWDRTNARGERLANGYYLYLAQGWDDGDRLVLNKAGKVVLLPGNQVELRAAPVVQDGDPWEDDEPVYGPRDYDGVNLYLSGQLGVGTDTPTKIVDIYGTQAQLLVESSGTNNTDVILRNAAGNWKFRANGAGHFVFRDEGNSVSPMTILSGAPDNSLFINSSGNVGLGTNLPSAKLHVNGNTTVGGSMSVGGPLAGAGYAEFYGPAGWQLYLDDTAGTGWWIESFSGMLGFIDGTISPGHYPVIFNSGAMAGTFHVAFNSGVGVGIGFGWLPRGGLEVSTGISGFPIELYLDDTTATGINQIYFDAFDTDWMIGVHGTAVPPYVWPGILTFTDQVRCPSGLHGFALWYDTGAATYRAEFGSGTGPGLDTCDVVVFGNHTITGLKSFVMPDPTDPGRSIYYAAMEGPESGTYIRGSAELTGGEAVIHLPDHFAKVTSDAGLTVTVTPVGDWLQLYVVEKSTTTIVVREAGGKDGTFDYRVEGVRSGYEDFAVYRDSTAIPAAFPEVTSTAGAADPTFAPDGQATEKIPVNIPSKPVNNPSE